MDEVAGGEADRGTVIRLTPQASDKGTNRQTVGPTPSPPDIEIDLGDGPADADEVAPSDFPVLVFLREQLRRLRSENRELRKRAEVERSRVAPLEAALARERRRASAAETETKELHRSIRKLEGELAKLRSKIRKRNGSDDQVGFVRRALRIPSRIRSHSEEIDPATAARIETIGKMAHLHKDLMERNNGHLTLVESLELRRLYYGDRVRASAALFGKRGSKAILYRDVPEGKRREPGDPVRLTEEGERLAAAYRRKLRR